MAPTTTHKRPVLTGTTVRHAGNEFEHDSFAEARETLIFLSAPEVEDSFSCGWVVELSGDRLPPEVDFPSDLVGECRAPARGTATGWQCLAGHSHVSGASYFEEDEVMAMAQAGHLPPADALYMDGRAVWS